jgi:predicted nucleotidyltransferase
MARVGAHPRLNFARLIAATAQRPTEVERAEARQEAIRTRLMKSFKVASIKPIGSYSRGTAIANHSDVDLLANLRIDEAKWGRSLVSSSTLLQRLRDDLTDRFVTTAVRRDGQAAVVSFARGTQRVDIVPALFLRFQDKNPVYRIPDGSGGWLETSPSAHSAWLRQQNLRSAGKQNRIARLLKYWKHCRGNTQPLSSFYLEIWLASSGVCRGVRSYSEILCDVFNRLDRESLKRIADPVGISGWLYPTKTAPQLEAIRTAIGTSAYHAAAAVSAEARSDNEEANRQWGLVFNGCF